MTKEEQKTLLQTIQARLEWNEKGGVDWIEDACGKWQIVVDTPKAPITKYFTPEIKTGIDPYGQIINDEKKQTEK